MTKIVIYKSGLTTGLSVKGHAGAGEYGEDIVCAGISSLAQSVLLSLEKYLHRAIDYRISESGCLEISLQEPADELTEAVFSVAILGFEEIAKAYPHNVQLKYQEVKINV